MTTIVATASQVKEGEVLAVTAENHKVILSRIDGKVYAVENKCPHLGLPLANGKVCDRVVTCRWHGASFDLTTGENVKCASQFSKISSPDPSVDSRRRNPNCTGNTWR